jgi:hypothetical protein
VISLTPWPLYPRGMIPRYSLDRRLGGPQGRSGRRGEKKSLTLPGLEIRPLGFPARTNYSVPASPDYARRDTIDLACEIISHENNESGMYSPHPLQSTVEFN